MLDKNIKYALSLEGGGFRGAYQAGAIIALHEEGFSFSAVVGTSIGSINGMMTASKNFDKLKKLWMSFDIKDVFDVPSEEMEKIISLDLKELNLFEAGKGIINTISNGGLDISPLMKLISDNTDEEKLRGMGAQFGLVTYNETDKVLMELMLEDMPKGSLPDFIMASSYLPGFKKVKLGGKYYLDGGYYNALPTNMLVERGYEHIIEIRLHGWGRSKPVEKDLNIKKIATDEDLGNIIIYNKDKINESFWLGYYDALKLAYDYVGKTYTIDAPRGERYYLESFLGAGASVFDKWKINLASYASAEKAVLAGLIPALESKLKIKREQSYMELYLAVLEYSANKFNIDRFALYSIIKFGEMILERAQAKKTDSIKDPVVFTAVELIKQNKVRAAAEFAKSTARKPK